MLQRTLERFPHVRSAGAATTKDTKDTKVRVHWILCVLCVHCGESARRIALHADGKGNRTQDGGVTRGFSQSPARRLPAPWRARDVCSANARAAVRKPPTAYRPGAVIPDRPRR